MFWFFDGKVCRILTPQPGIKLNPLHWKVKSSPLRPPGKSLPWFIISVYTMPCSLSPLCNLHGPIREGQSKWQAATETPVLTQQTFLEKQPFNWMARDSSCLTLSLSTPAGKRTAILAPNLTGLSRDPRWRVWVHSHPPDPPFFFSWSPPKVLFTSLSSAIRRSKAEWKGGAARAQGKMTSMPQWATNFPLPTPTWGCPVHTQSWAAFCEIGRSFLRAPSLSIRQKHLWLQVWIGMLSVSWQPERAWIPSHVLKLYKSSTNCTDAEEITNNAL